MKVLKRTLLFLLLIVSTSSYGNCVKVGTWAGAHDTNSGLLSFDSIVINVAGDIIQPNGTLLTSAYSLPAQYGQRAGYNPEDVLFRCAPSDEDQIFEVFSTNGDSAYAGMTDISGVTAGVTGVYRTVFRNIGAKIIHLASGLPFLKNWQERKLINLDKDANGNILVKVKNFSPISVELYKSNDTGGAWLTGSYTYSQPNGYATIRGPGMNEGLIAGTNSQFIYYGFYGYWPIAIGLLNNITVRRVPACVFRMVTPYVLFPTISVEQINNGEQVERDFTVSYDCEKTYSPGTVMNQVAIGLKPTSMANVIAGSSDPSFKTHLVDYEYLSQPEVAAQGVGIRIVRNGSTMNLLYDENNFGGGENAGWYSATGSFSDTSDLRQVTETWTAVLEALPSGAQVTPGRVKATAKIIIRVQ